MTQEFQFQLKLLYNKGKRIRNPLFNKIDYIFIARIKNSLRIISNSSTSFLHKQIKILQFKEGFQHIKYETLAGNVLQHLIRPSISAVAVLQCKFFFELHLIYALDEYLMVVSFSLGL